MRHGRPWPTLQPPERSPTVIHGPQEQHRVELPEPDRPPDAPQRVDRHDRYDRHDRRARCLRWRFGQPREHADCRSAVGAAADVSDVDAAMPLRLSLPDASSLCSVQARATDAAAGTQTSSDERQRRRVADGGRRPRLGAAVLKLASRWRHDHLPSRCRAASPRRQSRRRTCLEPEKLLQFPGPPASKPAPATPASRKPCATPARSAADRFWPTFHLPVNEDSTISMPTMACNIAAM